MMKGLGERTQTGETTKSETGGFTQENMSSVPFAGDTMRAPVKSPEERAAEARARAEQQAKMRADLMKMQEYVNRTNAVGGQVDSMNANLQHRMDAAGLNTAVRLDNSKPKKRFGLFGRKTG